MLDLTVLPYKKLKIKNKNKHYTNYETQTVVIKNAALGYILLTKQSRVKCFYTCIKEKETT